MEIFEDTTPQAYPQVIEHLRMREARDSRAGAMREEVGVLIRSEDPRERYLFRDDTFNLAFQLQEHWAYWAGANPGHVERYNSNMETWLDDDGELPGSAYGDRMRNTAGHDQIARALRQLRENPDTRRAYIAVHQPAVEDYDGGDVACTAYLHPMLRDEELHMLAAIRSQDMYWGYPYDSANNQWIQEIMARELGADLGEYIHFVDSCHYYEGYETEVLDSVASAEPSRSRPYEPEQSSHDDPFGQLTKFLKCFRSGSHPGHVAIEELPAFMADWALVMSAYERARFHDDEGATEDARRIGNNDWRRWTRDAVERHL